jgi:hypothetical protein
MMRFTHTYACWDMKQRCLSGVRAPVSLLGGDHHGIRPHRPRSPRAVSIYPAVPISLSELISDEASLRQLFLYKNYYFFLVTLFRGVESRDPGTGAIAHYASSKYPLSIGDMASVAPRGGRSRHPG